MKTANYRGLDGKDRTVEYDPDAPCLSCGLAVVSASMAGTKVCPWCDCGVYRDGTRWSIEDAVDESRRKAKAKVIQESL